MMPSRNDNHAKVFPERHSCQRPKADTHMFDEERAKTTAMPFHPTCLEVVKRALLQRLGSVDIRSLTDWFELTAPIWKPAIKRHPAMERGAAQECRHVRGNEFLASNPCYIPAL